MSIEQDSLDKRFNDAVLRASNTDKVFPPDVHLFFYAYYKRALGEQHSFAPSGENDLTYAFVQNAFFQVRSITQDEAKQLYIETVEKYVDSDD